MQEPQDGLDRLWRELPMKGKAKSNSKETACMLLADKLYFDYTKAYGKLQGVEAEHFAEEWIKKNAPDNDRIMEQSIWRHFIKRLSERRKGRYK